MSLPPGARLLERVGGGDLNQAFHVILADGSEAFVKTRQDPAPGEYAAEAAALQWLAEPGALSTPQVLACEPDYLALEWIEPAPSARLDRDREEQLGRGLALTHQAGAPCFGDPHPDHPSGFAWLRLSDAPTPDWPTFYAERRLAPLARIAEQQGVLSPAAVAAVEHVCERIGAITGPPETPARLHGDLWSGNILAGADGRPWLIDPAAYGGHREVDLAMLRLFGSLSGRLLDAYEELAPLADGWRERVELYQLLPLLVHALLFGGSYITSAERIARRYAG